MISRLRGLLLDLDDEEAVIEVGTPTGGIGYAVRCGVRTLAQMPPPGEAVTLFIDSQTREDGTRLYGFLSKGERKAFQGLQGVQGVGPKAALSVLDILSPSELMQAVARDDKAAVGRANGVGPKLAQRIVTELKDKVLTDGGTFAVSAFATPPAPVAPSLNGECVSALIGLGIPEAQSRRAVDQALNDLGPEAELAAVIRASLKALGR